MLKSSNDNLGEWFLQAISTIDKMKAAMTASSGALFVLALFTTAQYRSAISTGTLVELSLAAALLVARQALAKWQNGYYQSTGPVYNFRKSGKDSN